MERYGKNVGITLIVIDDRLTFLTVGKFWKISNTLENLKKIWKISIKMENIKHKPLITESLRERAKLTKCCDNTNSQLIHFFNISKISKNINLHLFHIPLIRDDQNG